MRTLLLIAPTFGLTKDNSVQAMMSAYKTAVHLSRHLRVIVIAAGNPPRHERLNPQLEIYRLPHLYLKDPINYMMPFSIFWKTYQLIRKEQPDIILINKFMFFNAFVIPLVKLMGKKVYTQVDAFPSIDWISRTPWIRPIMWLYLRCVGLPLLWLSDFVILFHERMVPIAERFHLKFTVIHNGVDVDEINTAQPAQETRLTNPSEIHLAFVGRLESMKGYDLLLRAWKRIQHHYPHATLFMVGNTIGKESIVQEFANPQTRFLGIRNDVPSLLRGITIFILPSYSEGLSNSLMEAMASGCACITMDSAGGNRVLIEPNITGVLAHVGDEEDLAKTMAYLIEHPEYCKEIGKAAQQRIRADYNWSTIAQQYLELFGDQGTRKTSPSLS